MSTVRSGPVSCAVENMLPIDSKNEKKILPGQHRTAHIRMLALWPDLGFLPYDQRTLNPECL
jgi:hypothetical protein